MPNEKNDNNIPVYEEKILSHKENLQKNKCESITENIQDFSGIVDNTNFKNSNYKRKLKNKTSDMSNNFDNLNKKNNTNILNNENVIRDYNHKINNATNTDKNDFNLKEDKISDKSSLDFSMTSNETLNNYYNKNHLNDNNNLVVSNSNFYNQTENINFNGKKNFF